MSIASSRRADAESIVDCSPHRNWGVRPNQWRCQVAELPPHQAERLFASRMGETTVGVRRETG